MVESIIEALRSIGALGVMSIAILDSSFLSLPWVNDILVATHIVESPDKVWYWPFLAVMGSVVGCSVLYGVSRLLGRVFLHRWFPVRHLKAVERVFERYGMLALIIPALCPPPMPLKTFVATAGVLQFPFWKFVLMLSGARLVRYYAVGVLALYYGERVENFIKEHALVAAVGIIAVVTLLFFVYHLVENRLRTKRIEPEPAPKDERLCA